MIVKMAGVVKIVKPKYASRIAITMESAKTANVFAMMVFRENIVKSLFARTTVTIEEYAIKEGVIV